MFTLENNVSSNAMLGYSFFNNNDKILALLIANRIFRQKILAQLLHKSLNFYMLVFCILNINVCFSMQPKIPSPQHIDSKI